MLCRYYVFYKLKVCGNPALSWHHFPNSICSFHVSMSLFGNSYSILMFFVIVFAMMICGIIITKRWGLAEGSGDGSSFLAIKYFLIRVFVFFRYNAIEHLISYNVIVTFICLEKPKKSCNLLYCNICFILELNPWYLQSLPVLPNTFDKIIVWE